MDINVVDLDLLAKAVAKHETWNCTLWYWKSQNNCFWIRPWNTAPCKEIKNNMCVYDTPEESYEAFKIIRAKRYRVLPTLQLAKKWSGSDRSEQWLKNVLYFYNNSKT